MRKLSAIFILSVLFAACGKVGPQSGPDYSKVKPALNLDKKQEKQFDKITAEFNEMRLKVVADARSGGKMNREALIAEIKKVFALQAEALKPVLNDEQFAYYSAWLEKQLPGSVGWSKELVAQIKSELALNEEKAKMVDAVNEAFIEAYVGAHDNYHGNNEAAKKYWTEFNNNRNEAVKQMLTEEQYAQYLEITKEVRFKGEHGKEEE